MKKVLLQTLLFALAACASVSPPDPAARDSLAPTGKLRVAVYPGSPTSMVKASSGETRGVTWELGEALAARLGVPFEPVVFARPAEVIEGLKAGKADITFTNASPARAKEVDFTPPLLGVEQGFLVPAGSRIARLDEVDRPGVRVGVSAGSTSEGLLTRTAKNLALVQAPNLKAAAEMLSGGKIDAFATNKAILSELADQLPGSRILDGRIGLEHMALGVPKGREAGLPYLKRFAQEVVADGTLARAVTRAGVRGTVPVEAAEAPKAEVRWLSHAAFRIASPGGKVIVIDPAMSAFPTTPPQYKTPEGLGKVDLLLVTHGHWDHITDAAAIAKHNNIPLYAPGDLNMALTTLGVLPPAQLPRANKSGRISPVPGIQVTQVHAEHSSVYVWRNPATGKDETHPGGEPVGFIVELENGFRLWHMGDTGLFGDMKWIAEHYKPDLVMIPVGGTFTMDAADAAYALREWIKPKYAIPMHYRTTPGAKPPSRQLAEALAGTPIKVFELQPGEAVQF